MSLAPASPAVSLPSSNFTFLLSGLAALYGEAAKAESLVYVDPRTACFYARRALEWTLEWLYQHESALTLPYQGTLSALIHDAGFVKLTGMPLQTKCRVIQKVGNAAAHETTPVSTQQSFDAVRELFHVTFWLARTYSKGSAPADALRFNGDLLPKATAAELKLREAEAASVKLQREAQERLLELTKEHEARLAAELAAERRLRDERVEGLLLEREGLLQSNQERDIELERMRAEIASIRLANAARPDGHDYDEAATRAFWIDALLQEAGWALSGPGAHAGLRWAEREVAVTGMPSPSGTGKVDYVLWGAEWAATGGGRGEADPAQCSRGTAAGEAICGCA